MSASRVNIKVSTAHLLAKVKESKAAAEKAHAEDVKNYDAKVRTWEAAVAKKVKEAIASHDFKVRYDGEVVISTGMGYRPNKPKLEFDSSGFDRDISALKLSMDDSLIVYMDGYWAKYL